MSPAQIQASGSAGMMAWVQIGCPGSSWIPLDLSPEVRARQAQKEKKKKKNMLSSPGSQGASGGNNDEAHEQKQLVKIMRSSFVVD